MSVEPAELPGPALVGASLSLPGPPARPNSRSHPSARRRCCPRRCC
ncbi:hypothetical protein [Nannocystis sp.]|nr:hypothetical protein [Nannocystis sp.]MBK7825302.1 hypothetical protein [Nannocystis sp.]